MIQHQTILKVADNSGAKTVKCLKVLNKLRYANIGDCIIVSVRSLKSGRSKGNTIGGKKKRSGTIKKGQIFKALVIRTKKGILQTSKRKHGLGISFEDNEVVLLSNQDNLIGSRIFGPITREIRVKNYRKVMSQSKKML